MSPIWRRFFGFRHPKKILKSECVAKVSEKICVYMSRHYETGQEEAGNWKEGKEREQAIKLYTASRKTNLKFSKIYDLAVAHHRPIAKYFGTDAGMKLMRMDSKVALRVLFHFTKQAHPCLCVHDSFVVPESQEDELRRVMIKFYRDETGFDPVVK